MFFQFIPGGVAVEKPFFNRIDVKFTAEQFVKAGFLSFGIYDLFRLKTVE